MVRVTWVPVLVAEVDLATDEAEAPCLCLGGDWEGSYREAS